MTKGILVQWCKREIHGPHSSSMQAQPNVYELTRQYHTSRRQLGFFKSPRCPGDLRVATSGLNKDCSPAATDFHTEHQRLEHKVPNGPSLLLQNFPDLLLTEDPSSSCKPSFLSCIFSKGRK